MPNWYSLVAFVPPPCTSFSFISSVPPIHVYLHIACVGGGGGGGVLTWVSFLHATLPSFANH